MSDTLSKPGTSKLYDMEQELKKLQDELMNLGSSVADSQIWHKKARIEELKKKIALAFASHVFGHAIFNLLSLGLCMSESLPPHGL